MGYVLPKSNANWCETYTSKGAKGDGRSSFWCFMKKTAPAPAPTPAPVSPTPAPSYIRSEGACRGGASPGNNAGLKFFRDRNCEARCNQAATCTGYVLPKSAANWCETYTSKGAKGDGRTQFWCFMKKTAPAPAPTPKPTNPTPAPNYIRSEGACRGGASPANNAGLKFFRDRNCEARCNQAA